MSLRAEMCDAGGAAGFSWASCRGWRAEDGCTIWGWDAGVGEQSN